MDLTKVANNAHLTNPSQNERSPDELSSVIPHGSNEENSPATSSLENPGSLADPAKSSQTGALLERLYGPVVNELIAVEQRLASELQSPFEAIGSLLRHGTQLGGKRMRPALVMLAGKSVGDLRDGHIVLATVVEMVHTATLIHDDVLDEASTRRHVATVNAKWSNHTSILLGDYLFSQSFSLAARHSSPTACQWIGEAARLVCEGELRQVLQRDALDIDESTYFDILRGKTAELCRVACQLGAMESGAPDHQVEALGKFGNSLGIAFQIADDFLDLWGSDDTVGKTLGTDVEQGKITLPLIRLLEQSTGSRREEVVKILSGPANKRVERIRPLLEASDARQYTLDAASRYRTDAIHALDAVPDTPAKASLLAIADFSIDRGF